MDAKTRAAVAAVSGNGSLDGVGVCWQSLPVAQEGKTHSVSLWCRLGFRLPPKYEPAARLIRHSEHLQAVAERLSWSMASPVDAAPLVRRAIYQLFAAVLLLDGHPVESNEACWEQIRSNQRYRALFAEIVDDVPFVDELSTSFEFVLGDEQAPRDRFVRLVKRMPGLLRKVRARLDAKVRSEGARPRPTLALGVMGLGLVAVVAAVAVSRYRGAEPTAPVGAEPSPTAAASVDSQRFAKRCFDATFFSDAEFRTAVHHRRDCQIAFDWGEEAVPDVPSLPADSFSVRWEGMLDPPESGEYRFYLTSDDGSRLYLDDVLVVDNWGAHGPAEVGSDPVRLEAGTPVPIVVEYYDLTELAQIKLAWSSASIAKQPLAGQYVRPRDGTPAAPKGDAPDGLPRGPSDCFLARYFAGRSFDEQVHQRRDCRISFDWGEGAPAGIEGLSPDDFSVRWEGTLRVPATDDYVFFLGSDDGSRLLLDGKTIVGDWSEHGFSFLASDPVSLREGVDYRIVVEFFEARELATVRLEWESASVARASLSGAYVSVPSDQTEPPSGDRPARP